MIRLALILTASLALGGCEYMTNCLKYDDCAYAHQRRPPAASSVDHAVWGAFPHAR